MHQKNAENSHFMNHASSEILQKIANNLLICDDFVKNADTFEVVVLTRFIQSNKATNLTYIVLQKYNEIIVDCKLVPDN